MVSFGWFFASAIVGFARSTAGVVSQDAGNAVAWGVLGMMVAAAIAVAAWHRDYRVQARRRKR